MSAAVVVMLSGCVGAPPLTIFAGLAERCFESHVAEEGSVALVGVTVANESPRSVILREVRVMQLENATVNDISVLPMPSVYTTFGVAPGGELSPDQLDLYRDRQPVDGAVIMPGGSVEVVVELRADDYTEYAGLRGLSLRYDDGWFSATSRADAVVGFVPAWAHCGSNGR